MFQDEEIFWAQRARNNWLSLGDKNTKFFQTQDLIRRKRNQILRIKDDYCLWHDDLEQISSIFINSYKRRFTVNSHPAKSTMLEFTTCISPCISAEDNANLLAPIPLDEVFQALHQIGPVKALGPDGLHAIFYHTFWNQVKDSLLSCSEFF